MMYIRYVHTSFSVFYDIHLGKAGNTAKHRFIKAHQMQETRVQGKLLCGNPECKENNSVRYLTGVSRRCLPFLNVYHKKQRNTT